MNTKQIFAKKIFTIASEQKRAKKRKTKKIEDPVVLNQRDRIFFQKMLDKGGDL